MNDRSSSLVHNYDYSNINDDETQRSTDLLAREENDYALMFDTKGSLNLNMHSTTNQEPKLNAYHYVKITNEPITHGTAPLITSRSVSQTVYRQSQINNINNGIINERSQAGPRVMQRSSFTNSTRPTIVKNESGVVENVFIAQNPPTQQNRTTKKMSGVVIKREQNLNNMSTANYQPATKLTKNTITRPEYENSMWMVSPTKTFFNSREDNGQPAAKRQCIVEQSDPMIGYDGSGSSTSYSTEKKWKKEDSFINDYFGPEMTEELDDEAWISSVDVSDFAGISKDLLGVQDIKLEIPLSEDKSTPTSLSSSSSSSQDGQYSYNYQTKQQQQTMKMQKHAPAQIVKNEYMASKECRAAPIPADGKFPKPTWSYSSLIALALKNSQMGQLTVSEIYAFMLENFPYFRTAPPGWKNSVRHNLSLNKCFQKVELDLAALNRKSCLWRTCPEKYEKLEQDIRKWRERGTVEGLARPEDLEAIENGTKGMPDMDYYSKSVLKTSCHENKSNLLRHPPSAAAASHLMSLVDSMNHNDGRNGQRMKKSAATMHTNGIGNNDMMASSSSSSSSSRSRLPVRRLPQMAPPVVKSRTPSPPLELDHLDFQDFEFVLYPSSCQKLKKYTDILNSPTKQLSDFLMMTPPKQNILRDEGAISPVRFVGCWSSFDSAKEALNDNSLMSAALDESPYKGPVTFPIMS